MIEDINKQRDSNKVLKLKVQSDIGELRRIYQVTGYKAEQPESTDTSPTPTGDLKGSQSEDLTMQLYRNRQRLMALRSAVQELENKTSASSSSSLLPSFAPSISIPALPPIEASSTSTSSDETKATTTSSVFMTARVPLVTTSQTASDTESKPVVEAEIEVEAEVEVGKEVEKEVEKEICHELHVGQDDTAPSKLHDYCADSHGVEGNRRPSIHVVSDL